MNHLIEKLSLAVLEGDLDRVSDLICNQELDSEGIKAGETKLQYQYDLLSCAIDKRHLNIVELLLNEGLQVNFESLQVSPLLHKAIESNDERITELLLVYGADVDKISTCPNSNKQKLFTKERNFFDQQISALHFAIATSQVKLVELLLDYCADVSLKTSGGKSPMHLALETGNLEIVQLLFHQGASVVHEGITKWKQIDIEFKQDPNELIFVTRK